MYSSQVPIYQKIKNQMNTFVGTITSQKYNLTTFSDSNIPAGFDTLLPYIKFIRDYNESNALANLKKAWNEYGRGQILTWTQFNSYVEKLANLTSYLNENDSSDNLFDKNMWDLWTDLYGSPNALNYPNIEANSILKLIFPDNSYKFEVKTIVLNEDDLKCDLNSEIIGYTSSAFSLFSTSLQNILLINLLFLTIYNKLSY
jgi:hypothetical protein